MKPVFQVCDISKTFSSRGKTPLDAIRQVSFQLYPGQVLGIAGESGSGKSTIARAAARLIDVSSGSILLHGQDITHARGKELLPVYRKIQMVFQSPVQSFDPMRTLGDGIGEGLRNMGFSKEETKKQTLKLLNLCGLSEEFALRYPRQVSGGQCQRAAIARALAIEPEILICDEATSALDVTVQKQIMELLQSLVREKGLACLFICHNLALVQSFCDQVIVMREGRIEESGTPDQIIFHPQSLYTRQLVQALWEQELRL